MVKMWRERMMQFAPPVHDTGALSRSVQGIVHPGPVTTIEHRFLEYGIYVCRGVGNGYRRGNPGDLPFLKDWKTNPHHRQKRDWFARKYMYSIHRLNDFEAAFYGTTYQGMVSSFLYQPSQKYDAVSASFIPNRQLTPYMLRPQLVIDDPEHDLR